jgi:hypothetical protein
MLCIPRQLASWEKKMKMNKMILAAMLGLMILPSVTFAAKQPRQPKDQHAVVAAKSHPFFKFIFGK